MSNKKSPESLQMIHYIPNEQGVKPHVGHLEEVNAFRSNIKLNEGNLEEIFLGKGASSYRLYVANFGRENQDKYRNRKDRLKAAKEEYDGLSHKVLNRWKMLFFQLQQEYAEQPK